MFIQAYIQHYRLINQSSGFSRYNFGQKLALCFNYTYKTMFKLKVT